MSRVVERDTGAQILPRPRTPSQDQKATAWSVLLCRDADLRAKRQVYRDIAASMIVERDHHAG